MNFKSNESSTKLRGGYYTPRAVAIFLSRWALHNKPEMILEPSCGDGMFIEAISEIGSYRPKFVGIEVLPDEADKAQARSVRANLAAEVIRADFLEWVLPNIKIPPTFDAVVGNPPYIRYQYLEKQSQVLAESIFTHFGLKFTKHTNAWVPFVIASIAVLRPGGRLAMVVPAEILHVLHATPLREFLLSQCERILLVDPNELLFDEALQGTVLLMAEKKNSLGDVSKGVAIVRTRNNDFLAEDPEIYFESGTYVSGDVLNGKWMKVLLTPEELFVFERVQRLTSVSRFSDLASVDVGVVTGANKFFLINDNLVRGYGLEEWVKPMFGRSEHCAGVIYDDQQHQKNRERGLPTNFVMFGDTPIESLSKSAQAYVAEGEKQQLHTRYKCRIRKPWYDVPSVYATKVGMLKRSHNFPRLILNTIGALTTDTAYRIKPYNIEAEKLVFCFVNSLTALSAELQGRHYGGGVLELVPSEIEKLLVPVPKQIALNLDELNAAISGDTAAGAVLVNQDKRVLAAAGISREEQNVLHTAWNRIRSRRQRLGHDGDEVAEHD